MRSEPLLAISREDALAEGVVRRGSASGGWFGVDGVEMTRAHLTPEAAYFDLWDAINGEGASAANPVVFATSFSVMHANVDDVLKRGA